MRAGGKPSPQGWRLRCWLGSPLRRSRFDDLRIERNGDSVRPVTRGGHDWTNRFPWIAPAARKNRVKRFVIDGEAVILGVDGISDFNALHSARGHMRP